MYDYYICCGCVDTKLYIFLLVFLMYLDFYFIYAICEVGVKYNLNTNSHFNDFKCSRNINSYISIIEEKKTLDFLKLFEKFHSYIDC